MDSQQELKEIQISESSSTVSRWKCFGQNFPRNEVVYFSQIFIIYIVTITCLANLSFNIGPRDLWIALLASCLGYILPQPSISKKNGSFLHHTT